MENFLVRNPVFSSESLPESKNISCISSLYQYHCFISHCEPYNSVNKFIAGNIKVYFMVMFSMNKITINYKSILAWQIFFYLYAHFIHPAEHEGYNLVLYPCISNFILNLWRYNKKQ